MSIRLENMRAMVTGGTGFLGANLVRSLLGRGVDTHAVVRPNSDRWRLSGVEHLVQIHVADLADVEALERTMGTVKPDLLYHTAAYVPRRGESDRAAAFAVNVVGTNNLLTATAPLADLRLVHIAGSTEFGRKDHPLKETEIIEPVSFYGLSKAVATLLMQHAARQEDRPIVTLRPFSMYGPWEGGYRWIPTTILSASKGRRLRLTGPGIRRDYVYVGDVVDACLRAAEADLSRHQTFNICSGTLTANEEVVAKVEKLMNRKIEAVPGSFPARPNDADIGAGDNMLAKEILGWTPAHSLEQGLAKTIAWHGEFGHHYRSDRNGSHG